MEVASSVTARTFAFATRSHYTFVPGAVARATAQIVAKVMALFQLVVVVVVLAIGVGVDVARVAKAARREGQIRPRT